MEKLFSDNMTLNEKKAQLETTAAMHNALVRMSGSYASTALAAFFSMAKIMVSQGEIAMAIYYISLCDDLDYDSLLGGSADDKNDLL